MLGITVRWSYSPAGCYMPQLPWLTCVFELLRRSQSPASSSVVSHAYPRPRIMQACSTFCGCLLRKTEDSAGAFGDRQGVRWPRRGSRQSCEVAPILCLERGLALWWQAFEGRSCSRSGSLPFLALALRAGRVRDFFFFFAGDIEEPSSKLCLRRECLCFKFYSSRFIFVVASVPLACRHGVMH